MAIGARQLSTDEWETDLGRQVRRARLAAGLDQLQLSDSASVSIGALRNLERGNGSTIRTLVRVVRALGREDWLAGLAPVAAVSPIDVFRGAHQPRTRVYRPRASGGPRTEAS